MNKCLYTLAIFIAMSSASGCAIAPRPVYPEAARQGDSRSALDGEPHTLTARSLARQISEAYDANSPVQRIALMPLRIQNESQVRSVQTLNDALRAELFNQRAFELVADHDMRRALAQQGTNRDLLQRKYLAESNSENPLEIGKLVKADAVLYGSVTQLAWNKNRVMVELIEVPTGTIVAVAHEILQL